MSPYRILSMDGGGIRGIVTATLLERLENYHPGFMAQFNLFAGTSTGGILTVGLASGLTPTQAREMYQSCGEAVFADSLWDDIRDLGNLIGAQYSIEPLEKVLAGQFGKMKLKDLPKKVLVSAFDLDNEDPDPRLRSWKPKFFHNYEFESDGEELVVDVAVRTSAAPTYFPVYQGYIDGGVVAGNPSVCALAQALHPPTGGQHIEDLVLLSVGTGHNPHFIEGQDNDWGLAQWAPNLVSLMLEGGAGTAHYQCKQILSDCYFRLNPALPYPIGMDAADQLDVLRQVAMELDLNEAYSWVDQYFD